AVQRRLLQVENHQPRAGLGETHGQGTADAGATAADQHHLAFEDLVGKHLAVHGSPPLRHVRAACPCEAGLAMAATLPRGWTKPPALAMLGTKHTTRRLQPRGTRCARPFSLPCWRGCAAPPPWRNRRRPRSSTSATTNSRPIPGPAT